jgi:hypothetical protein
VSDRVPAPGRLIRCRARRRRACVWVFPRDRQGRSRCGRRARGRAPDRGGTG